MDSIIKIGNRFTDSIKAEIALLPERIKENLDTLNFGFTFHNLAAPCEIFTAYQAEKFGENHSYLIGQIEMMGKIAREIQDILDELPTKKECADKKRAKVRLRKAIISANEIWQKLVPSLFFI